MKTFPVARGGLFAGLAAMALTTSPAGLATPGPVPFKAQWTANIVTTPLDFPLVAVTGSGSGLASHLGKMTPQSVDEVVNLATGEGLALYTFTAANGDKLFLTFIFLAVPTSPVTFAIEGDWQVTDGTGRFEGASGNGQYSGEVTFNSASTAVGQFSLVGVLTPPGHLH